MRQKSPIRDQGWTSPWLLVDKPDHDGTALTQDQTVRKGDMALEATGTRIIERHFSDVSSGVLSIEMTVMAENTNIGVTHHNVFFDPAYDDRLGALREADHTLGLNHPLDSVMKAYASDGGCQWAFRWHYPYAWPEVGGNTYPRFYVMDGQGTKRRGLEATDFRIEDNTWYNVTTILDFTTQTWQFQVDGVAFEPPGKPGRAMAWARSPAVINTLRLTFLYSGRHWINSIRISHNDELIAGTGFSQQDGYAPGRPVTEMHAVGQA